MKESVLKWKIIIPGIITFLLMVSPIYGEGAQPFSPEKFARKLKQIIMENDIEAYDRLHIGQLLDDGKRGDVFSVISDKPYGNYIFGTERGKFSIRRFLLEQKTIIYINSYGAPTTYDIIYYNPKKVNYPKNSSEEMKRRCWNKCFVQTTIELVDGKWRIPGTSFYSERDLPWVGEYG